MKIGSRGISLIQSYEKCKLRAYKPTPDDVWTCGWGSTKGVTPETVWTQEEADKRFLEDLEWVEKCVNKSVKVTLTQPEFDACCALCFNIGCGAFSKSSVVRHINEGDFEAASIAFSLWDKQAGRVLDGLVRRRLEERRLFEETP